MKNIVKITAVAAIAFTATGVFAAPHHEHHKETNGIRLAADIINLVHSTVNLLTGTPNTVVINQTNAVVPPPPPPCPPQQTVIVNNPPTPPPQTIVINNHRPRPNKTVIINNKPFRTKTHPVQHHYGKPVVKNIKHNFADLPQHRRR